MMLGPEKKAVVVRKPDGGLEEQVEERVLIKDKHPALGLPLLRGVFNFCSSLANGVKALMYSASFFPEAEEEPEEPSRFELWLDRHLGSEKAASFFITVAVVLGIVFSVGLFILVPTAITGLVAAQPAGRRGAYRHLHGLSDALFPYEGHPPGVPVPRRGAQDHLLL